MTISADNAHDQWLASEAEAETMIPMIGKLNRENNVVVSIHGHTLINKSVIQILKAHRFARQIDDVELDPADSLSVLQIVQGLTWALAPSILQLSGASLRNPVTATLKPGCAAS